LITNPGKEYPSPETYVKRKLSGRILPGSLEQCLRLPVKGKSNFSLPQIT
jgi:hypothetical protein